MTPRKTRPPAPKDDDDGEHRTEVTTEYHGAKVNVKIGRGGSALLWAIAWAIVIISTLIGLGMLVNLLDKIGLLGCFTSATLYLMSLCSAYSSRSPWR